jgi:hypothetical protein
MIELWHAIDEVETRLGSKTRLKVVDGLKDKMKNWSFWER